MVEQSCELRIIGFVVDNESSVDRDPRTVIVDFERMTVPAWPRVLLVDSDFMAVCECPRGGVASNAGPHNGNPHLPRPLCAVWPGEAKYGSDEGKFQIGTDGSASL